jgi:GDP-L-fucose synthase
MNKDSKIYVAGHRGLVGSAIYSILQQKGYTNLVGRTHAQLDLLDPVAVRNFFDSEHPDVVVLAAALVGGIMANSTRPADFIFHNLQIQQNVIGEAYRHNVSKLLFLGSTCIYPRMAPQPMREESLLTSPLEATNEPYALAKIAGMKMCHAFNRQYGTNYIAVMPTNLYGPNDNFHLVGSHVLPAMMRKIYLAKCLLDSDHQALLDDLRRRPVEGIAAEADYETVAQILSSRFGIQGSELLLWGTGTPLREFLWSEDMASACVYMLENVNAEGGDLVAGETRIADTNFVNVGTGIEHSIADVAAMVSDAVGYSGKIRFDATKPDGTPRKLTDPSRLHRLGWHHTVELAEGIKRLYDWYRAN